MRAITREEIEKLKQFCIDKPIGFYDQRGKNKNKPTLSGKKASETPHKFIEELISIAEKCK